MSIVLAYEMQRRYSTDKPFHQITYDASIMFRIFIYTSRITIKNKKPDSMNLRTEFTSRLTGG
jgi:hypothetical protein